MAKIFLSTWIKFALCVLHTISYLILREGGLCISNDRGGLRGLAKVSHIPIAQLGKSRNHIPASRVCFLTSGIQSAQSKPLWAENITITIIVTHPF